MTGKKQQWNIPVVVAALLIGWWILRDPAAFFRLLRWLVQMVSPFLWGGALAFVLHVPLRAIERRLPACWKKRRRAAALILTLLSVAALMLWVVGLVLPQLANTAASLGENLPCAWEKLCLWLEELRRHWPLLNGILGTWQPPAWQQFLPWLADSLKRPDIVHSTVNAAQGFVNGAVDFFIGLAFAVYLLAQKERLAEQCRMFLYAFLPSRRVDGLLEVMSLTERVFSAFLSGQCLEACILGCMFAVGMLLCHMPYVTLISVLISVTALVPVFGTLVGCAAGTLLIAVQRPMQAVWFVVLFLCLQQIEGTFVYPRVVGNSVGLPPIWVLASVTLGGNLFGVAGILLMIPLCSVGYALLRREVLHRLKLKNIAKTRYQKQNRD